jgi:hypothetical protein
MDWKTGLCTACLLLIPAVPDRADAPANPLDKALSHYAAVDGMKIHYKTLGTGTTALVFVHGWTADMTSWSYQVPGFDGKVRMILVDLPSHGKSDKPKIDYTMEAPNGYFGVALLADAHAHHQSEGPSAATSSAPFRIYALWHGRYSGMLL